MSSKKKSYLLTTIMTVCAVLLLAGVTLGPVLGCGGGVSEAIPKSQIGNDTGLSTDTINNEAFKEKFPKQYESYMQNGPAGGDQEHPSKFVDDNQPLLPALWFSNAFSKDYNERRGHGFAIEDVTNTLRTNEDTAGGCLTCKSSAVPKLIAEKGEAYYTDKLFSDIMPAADEMGQSPVGCSDCHDPATMELRPVRPHFVKGLESRGIDLANANQKDMQSYVCGQCHSTYFFYPETKEVTVPWAHLNLPRQTMRNELFPTAQSQPGDYALEMYAYFQNEGAAAGFKGDFVHGISGAHIFKPRHPEFENSHEGSHKDLSCSDCHMPTVTTGEGEDMVKFTNHHLGSPLENPEPCMGCHSTDMDKRVEAARKMQASYKEKLLEAQYQSLLTHYYVNRMITAGADADLIAELQTNIGYAQWLWDLNAAENGNGFHNPAGADRLLNLSIESSTDTLAKATEALQDKGVDISELKARIADVITAMKNEPDTSKKRDFASNDYFPDQTPAP
ncbi:MAG: ammonia-forming cytochrome c nitrite reductase subunit c552 [Coriobacteriia bacterium]|nr:ammonia-forming cytochrome c nitrite reductase subunit c552 [Coriobacteriia bacterium]MCL2537143.1 ammonia-forming cytochrome c nitrite reductase subunit c552 [Coriobacteriia bacterium]